MESRERIDQTASFVSKKIIERYNLNKVLNTNQVEINLEVYGNRTLTRMGKKPTWNLVRSIGETTHSHTKQRAITLDGTVFDPLYLCLKEPTGHTSDYIKKNLFNSENIGLKCSKSGKLISSLVIYCCNHCLILNLPTKALLIVDSFPFHANSWLYKNLKIFEYRIILPKTTSTIQPLDVFYNRQYKMIL